MNAAIIDILLRTLAANAVYSAILLAIVAPIAWALRGRSPQMRHALWTIVLLRLLLPPSFALPTSLWSAVSSWSDPERIALTLTIAAEPSAGPAALRPLPFPLIPALWLSGSGLVALAMVRSRRSLRKLVECARPIDEPRALRAFERARARLGVRRRVDLATGPADVGAFTIGTIRPAIFVPEGMLAKLSEASLECVLAHELAHVRRFDDFARQVQASLQAVYFFNPVVWVAGALRSRENELVCDSLAVTRGNLEPATYGRSIVHVLRLGGDPMPHALMFLGRRSTLKNRIDSVFHARPLSKATTAAAIVIGLILLPMSAGAGAPAMDEPVPAATIAPATDKPVPVEGDVVPPKVLTKVYPAYPPDARAEGAEGEVVVRATIEKDGRVSGVETVKATRDDFAAAAMDATRQWTFAPATLKGKPIAVTYSMTLRFRLSDKKDKE